MLQETAALLGNREAARDSQKEIRKDFLEALDQLRHTSGLRTHGFLALPAEGTTLCVCSHLECNRIRPEILVTQFPGGLTPADTWFLLVTRFHPQPSDNIKAIRFFLFALMETEVYLESTHCS